MQDKWCKLGADFPLFKQASRQWESQNSPPCPAGERRDKDRAPSKIRAGGRYVSGMYG
jgi:hypothetical protein